MCKTVDIVSQQYGLWTVLERRASSKSKGTMYLCRCACGTEKVVSGSSLRRGDSTSCGCRQGRPGGHAPDLTGHFFGRWTVVQKNGQDKRGAEKYLCRCVCGEESSIVGYSLRRGDTKSCGCLAAELAKERSEKGLGIRKPGAVFKTHGMRGTPEYSTWSSMKGRCKNPKYENYPNYGGRGITFDPAWEKFESFYADMGPRPQGASLDRIDVNGNYEPGNCRWGTEEEQCNNRTNARLVEYNGKAQTITQWSRELGIKYGTIHNRLGLGWPIERALTEAVEVHNRCQTVTTSQ